MSRPMHVDKNRQYINQQITTQTDPPGSLRTTICCQDDRISRSRQLRIFLCKRRSCLLLKTMEAN